MSIEAFWNDHTNSETLDVLAIMMAANRPSIESNMTERRRRSKRTLINDTLGVGKMMSSQSRTTPPSTNIYLQSQNMNAHNELDVNIPFTFEAVSLPIDNSPVINSVHYSPSTNRNIYILRESELPYTSNTFDPITVTGVPNQPIAKNLDSSPIFETGFGHIGKLSDSKTIPRHHITTNNSNNCSKTMKILPFDTLNTANQFSSERPISTPSIKSLENTERRLMQANSSCKIPTVNNSCYSQLPFTFNLDCPSTMISHSSSDVDSVTNTFPYSTSVLINQNCRVSKPEILSNTVRNSMPSSTLQLEEPYENSNSKAKPQPPKSNTKPKSSQKRHACPIAGCNKKFTRTYNLRSHLRCHTNERPFACNINGCHSSFVRRHDLKRHQVSLHAGFKPFKCPYCDLCFSRKDAFNKHLQVEERRINS